MLSQDLSLYKKRISELTDLLRSSTQVTGPQLTFTAFIDESNDSNILSGMKNRHISHNSALAACDVVGFAGSYIAFLKFGERYVPILFS